MRFRRTLIGGLATLILATGIGGCGREEPARSYSNDENTQTTEKRDVENHADGTCNLHVYSDWADLNNNGLQDNGEFLDKESFSISENIEFYVIGRENTAHESKLVFTNPNREEAPMRHLDKAGNYRFNCRLTNDDKMPGKYQVKFYVDKELKQEKSFEITPYISSPAIR